MEILKVNETPVRTSKNFNINNIKLENIVLPENVKKFETVNISGDCNVSEDAKVTNISYGMGEKLHSNIAENVNSSIKITGSNAKVIYNFDNDNLNLINYVEIVADKDINVVMKYSSDTNHECFANSIIKLISHENVKANIIFVNMMNENSNCFVSIENELSAGSELNYTIIDLGAKNSIQNYYSNILGKDANNNLESIYVGKENQIKDINYIAELYGENDAVNINVQGALLDSAKKNFKGTIDFKKGCKKSKGDENEYCMLLSEHAKSIALPMLLCTEDDVEGNHATASGKLDDKEIFYIMSRGLDKKEATKLIVRARFNSILEKLFDEDIKNEVIEEIDRRLD